MIFSRSRYDLTQRSNDSSCQNGCPVLLQVDLIPEGVNPWDPAWFGAVTLMLLATGLAAAWIPARRAAQVDPSIALRQE